MTAARPRRNGRWSRWPKLAIYKGTVWATWDQDAPDFLTYLGDAKIHLDQALDCRDGRQGGSEVIGVHKWMFPSNWKFAAENFLGDTYHNPSHRSVDLIGIGPSAPPARRAGATTNWKRRSTSGSAFRKATACTARSSRRPTSTSNRSSTSPLLEQYFRHCFEERKRRLGEQARLMPFVGTIFPNASYHGRQPRGLCAWHPHSPTETEGWRFFLVDADAPEEVKDFLRRYYMRYSGPGRDDRAGRHGELALCDPASIGTVARRYPFNYQQSMGAWTRDHARSAARSASRSPRRSRAAITGAGSPT